MDAHLIPPHGVVRQAHILNHARSGLVRADCSPIHALPNAASPVPAGLHVSGLRAGASGAHREFPLPIPSARRVPLFNSCLPSPSRARSIFAESRKRYDEDCRREGIATLPHCRRVLHSSPFFPFSARGSPPRRRTLVSLVSDQLQDLQVWGLVDQHHDEVSLFLGLARQAH